MMHLAYTAMKARHSVSQVKSHKTYMHVDAQSAKFRIVKSAKFRIVNYHV